MPAAFCILNSALLRSRSSTTPLQIGLPVPLRSAHLRARQPKRVQLGSGLMAWLFGAPGTVHIGASGVIFGYLGFLMLTGWYTRSFFSILLSVVVTLVWGSLVLGMVPGAPGISWQAHVGGFLGGILAARAVSRRLPARVEV